jgi:hypothetical protein
MIWYCFGAQVSDNKRTDQAFCAKTVAKDVKRFICEIPKSYKMLGINESAIKTFIFTSEKMFAKVGFMKICLYLCESRPKEPVRPLTSCTHFQWITIRYKRSLFAKLSQVRIG